MHTSKTFTRLFTDGLVGVVIVLPIFLIVASLLVYSEGMSSSAEILDFIEGVFFFPRSGSGWFFISPMPFVLLTVFIGMMVSGLYLERSSTRGSLVKNVLIAVAVSWFIGIIGFGLFFIFGILFSGAGWFNWDTLGVLMGILASGGGIGAGIGLVLGATLGVIFNPTRRFPKILIGSIASALMGYGIGFAILLPQIML